MLGISDIKSGKSIILNGIPYAVLYHEHSKTGRAGSVLRTRLKNLTNGTVLEKTFQGADKIEEATITKSKAQFLYREGENFAFMDMESYEQFSLPAQVLASAVNYLIEGTEIIVLNWSGTPINIELPVKVKLKVVETPPGVRGNTVSTGGKLAKLETGLSISVPLFIKEGEEVIVNTERGEYVGRPQN